MTGQEYGTRVAGAMERATRRERREIAGELAAHVEDRTEALVAEGWTLREAEDWAVRAMGDPEEIARALDEQLSPLWLWVGRLGKVWALGAALALAVVLIAEARGLGGWFWARWYPQGFHPELPAAGVERQTLEWRETLPSGDVLYVYRLERGPTEGFGRVYFTFYDPIPFGRVGKSTAFYLEFQGEDESLGRGGTGSPYYWQGVQGVKLLPGQETLKLWYDRYGKDFVTEIPLGEVEP